MADIKTRDAVKGTIKTIDKAAVAGQRMKQAYISTKDKAEHSTSAAENSAIVFPMLVPIKVSKIPHKTTTVLAMVNNFANILKYRMISCLGKETYNI